MKLVKNICWVGGTHTGFGLFNAKYQSGFGEFGFCSI